MKKFLFLKLLVLVACMSSTLSAAAYDLVIDGIYYNFIGQIELEVTYKDTGYNSYSGDVNIPPGIFLSNGIYYHVTSIGKHAFRGCHNLTSVTLNSQGLYSTVGDSAFYLCDNLSRVNLPVTTLSIGTMAFANCYSLTNFDIPLYVSSIGSEAFVHCTSLTYINIPNSVMSLGNSAFGYCKNLTSVLIGAGLTTIPKEAFFSCYELSSVTIPSNITTIGDEAFAVCRKLRSVNIGSNVTSIGDHAFWGDSLLTEVVIPDKVTTIGPYAFINCVGIQKFTIGKSVTSIGDFAFHRCYSLTSITSNCTTPPTIQSNTFGVSQYTNATLHVPSTTAVNNYKAANYWRNFYLILPNDGTELDYALNVSGGNIHFTSTGTYPWTVQGDGTRVYAQSGNAGVASSTSTMTASVSLSKPHVLTFDFKAWGEGTYYDKCIFLIDDVEQFSYGARDNDWETYTANIPAGTHTFTWTYSKDSSVNAEGDYFAVDNVGLTEISSQLGDVNDDGQITISDVTALIDSLLSGLEVPTHLADVNGDGQVTISDVTALIDFLLTGTGI